MKEKLKENFKNKKTIVLLLVGALVFLGTIIGATYAYLGIVSTNSATNTSTTGALSGKGNVTLTTNTSNLYINLDAVDLS